MIPNYQQQLDLVSKGYAKVSRDGDFDTFKYSRKVMFDYLWDDLKKDGIFECRGHVYNNKTEKLIQLPEQWKFAVEIIKETFKLEGWASLNDQQRRIELEEMEMRYE